MCSLRNFICLFFLFLFLYIKSKQSFQKRMSWSESLDSYIFLQKTVHFRQQTLLCSTRKSKGSWIQDWITRRKWRIQICPNLNQKFYKKLGRREQACLTEHSRARTNSKEGIYHCIPLDIHCLYRPYLSTNCCYMGLTLFGNSSILDHFLLGESSILMLKMPLCLMGHILRVFKYKTLLSFL